MAGKLKRSESQRSIADRVGVTPRLLSMWQKDGIDIYDDGAICLHIRSLRTLPPNLKPDFMPAKIDRPDLAPSIAETAEGIERIRQELLAGVDYNTARTHKMRIDALNKILDYEINQGRYTSNAVIQDAFSALGAKMRSMLMSLTASLPPMLEGRDPIASQRIIRGELEKILRMISDEEVSFFEQE